MKRVIIRAMLGIAMLVSASPTSAAPISMKRMEAKTNALAKDECYRRAVPLTFVRCGIGRGPGYGADSCYRLSLAQPHRGHCDGWFIDVYYPGSARPYGIYCAATIYWKQMAYRDPNYIRQTGRFRWGCTSINLA